MGTLKNFTNYPLSFAGIQRGFLGGESTEKRMSAGIHSVDIQNTRQNSATERESKILRSKARSEQGVEVFSEMLPLHFQIMGMNLRQKKIKKINLLN